MIYLVIKGGLGNQLYQLAFTEYMSKKYNLKIFIDTKYLSYNILFNSQRFFSLDKLGLNNYKKCNYFSSFIVFCFTNLCKKLNIVKLSIFSNYIFIVDDSFNDFNQMTKPSFIILNGYFQNLSNQQIVIKDFILKNKSILNYKNFMYNFQNKVCVHIRRGDYLKYMDTFKVQELKYYIESIRYIKDNIKSPIFLFFSDDKEYVLNNFQIDNINSFHISTNNDTDDFLIMSNCSHFIISNSTFSLWAALFSSFNNKLTIYPKNWFVQDVRNQDFINKNIPYNWLPF